MQSAAESEIDVPFDAALSERYLVYALSTITARSLPDVRDGLKPVHRRLLWAMRLLRLDPAGAFKKSARVVGDVIGKYHPHGDQSVYDAMVRLAQDFALRYPLVDGQGNFGNIDGDNAAAYRYTEARLTPIAAQLMAGLDEGTVEFKPTYNGEEEEPEVFPGLFPNLLANGASGIAVGMATSIPPHNVGELIDAAVRLIENPKTEDAALMEFVRGPDFPTGGVLVDSREMIASAYASGRGSFRLRASISIEREKGGGWHLLVSQMPYGVQKGRLIEQVAALIADKKLPILADVRDESDEQVRLVLEPRSRTVDAQLLLESLYRLTDLEIRFPLNLNVLDANRTPGVMSLKQALTAWLAFQIEVLLNRSRTRIGKIDDRLELLDGFLVAFLNLDRVIAIIRTEDEPKPVLIAEFELSDRQAEAILAEVGVDIVNDGELGKSNFSRYTRVAFPNESRLRHYLQAGVVTEQQAALIGYPKAWSPGFDGNVDALTIRVNDATVVYDFEPLSDVGTFQFSQANYTINESQASVTITVTRTGMTAEEAAPVAEEQASLFVNLDTAFTAAHRPLMSEGTWADHGWPLAPLASSRVPARPLVAPCSPVWLCTPITIASTASVVMSARTRRAARGRRRSPQTRAPSRLTCERRSRLPRTLTREAGTDGGRRTRQIACGDACCKPGQVCQGGNTCVNGALEPGDLCNPDQPFACQTGNCQCISNAEITQCTCRKETSCDSVAE